MVQPSDDPKKHINFIYDVLMRLSEDSAYQYRDTSRATVFGLVGILMGAAGFALALMALWR